MIEVWPVIHAKDANQVVECAMIARIARCPGVFLISMHGDDESLDKYANLIWREVPYLRVGVNYITFSPVAALVRSRRIGYDATWTDRQMFTGGTVSQEAYDILAIAPKNHKFFTAVSFKGQPNDPSPERSAAVAASCYCTPTTSGTSTGVPPSVEKIKKIREGMSPQAPLAIASGITPENVVEYKPYVSHILVSTGISKSFHEFDLGKLMLLKEALK